MRIHSKAWLVVPLLASMMACSPTSSVPSSATAIDGDTFKFGGVHYRIAAIDAPELPGHCRVGRHCAPGDPFAAKRALQQYLDTGDVRCQPIGLDRYQRTLVTCTINGTNLGDDLIALGYAIRWPHD